MKKYLFAIVSVAMVVIILCACSPKPDEVSMQLATAINNKDLDGAVELFADDAVVTSVSPEPFTGKEQIRGWLEGMIADNFHLEVEITSVEGNVVHEFDTMMMDSMKFYGIETLTGTSEVVVESGKIRSLSFSWSDETLADLQNAPFIAPEDLIGTWTVGTMMKINPDGTLRVAYAADDLALPISEEHPGSLEEWSYDGMVFTMVVVEAYGDGTCNPGDVGLYFIRWAGDNRDRIKFKPIFDDCSARIGGMQWGNWAPMNP